MADVHPVHHLLPIKKPVFIAFHTVSNLYKGQEEISDEPDSNPVYPVILSKNSLYIYCLSIQNDEEPKHRSFIKSTTSPIKIHKHFI